MDPLPIDPLLDEIADAASGGAVVVEAPTGAGKTTRIPPHLRADGQVWVVEPRRVAARAAARRMAQERRWKLGEEVGWHVRFDRKATDRSKVVVVTGGILLQRLRRDPFLEGIGAVVFDEVHERALDLDLGLALVGELREARDDLQVVAMSATLDGQRLAEWLDAPRVTSEGRSFPVDIRYRTRPDARPVWDQVADGVRDLLAEGPGDLLAFLPGVREIRLTAERLTGLDVDIVQLYGDLPPDKQDAALTVGARRRVVLATNVAESSVTVPGVTGVVDSGLVRRPIFDPDRGIERLDTVRISQASADQRAGRAGRTAPGRCLRLWTERAHNVLDAYDPPEIARSSLAGPVLQLLEQGIDPRSFGWFEAPPEQALDDALRLLEDLGAVDGLTLTGVGRELARIPLHPRLARMLVECARGGQGGVGALAAAWLSERDPLRDERFSGVSGSDLLERVEALLGGRGHPVGRAHLTRVADQLARIARRTVSRTVSRPGPDALARGVLAGWPERVARRREPGSRRALDARGEGVVLDRDSVVREEIFVGVVLGERDGADRRVRVASPVERDWLAVESGELLEWDRERERVRAYATVQYRGLVLESHPSKPDRARAARRLFQEASTQIDRVQPSDEAWPQLLARVGSVHGWIGDPWPAVDDALLTGVLDDLCHGRRSFGELRSADWAGALRDRLGWPLWSELEKLAPERIQVPTGSRIRIRYSPGEAPVLAVRMQQVFGWRETPRIAGGRVPLRLELLAPNGRPQQVTEDLAGFWERTWPEIRKELRGRYPKHAWPEDPHA